MKLLPLELHQSLQSVLPVHLRQVIFSSFPSCFSWIMNRQLHHWKQPAYFPAKLSIPVNYLEYLRPHFLLDTLSKSRARSASTTMIFPFWEIAASMTPLDLILWAVAWLQPKSLLMPNRPYTYRFSLDGFVLALPSLPVSYTHLTLPTKA